MKPLYNLLLDLFCPYDSYRSCLLFEAVTAHALGARNQPASTWFALQAHTTVTFNFMIARGGCRNVNALFCFGSFDLF
jgi:hypothetical protein